MIRPYPTYGFNFSLLLFFPILFLTFICCIDASAHIPTWESKYPGDPNPFGVVGHFCPNTPADPCWKNKTCGIGLKQYEGGHGHINDNGTWGYWGKDSARIWDDGNTLDCGSDDDDSDDDDPPRYTPPSGTDSTRLTDDGQTPSLGADDRRFISDEYGSGDCHEWNFVESPYISVPVEIDGVTNIITLRRYLKRRTGEYLNLAVFVDGRWVWYPSNREIGKTPITPNLGIRVRYRDTNVEACGNPIAGEIVELTLPEGKKNAFYMVGFPEVPANYEMRSDLLVDNLVWVQRRVWTGFYKNTTNEHVSRYHQDDDAEIEPGQAFFVRINGDVTLDLRGTIPAQAPMAQRQGSLATSWGAMKRWK